MHQLIHNPFFLISATLSFLIVFTMSRRARLARRAGGQAKILPHFDGTYRGCAPTDESAVAMGEIEIVLKDGVAKVRMATGHMIQEEELSLADFRPMSSEEIAQNFAEGYKAEGLVDGFMPNDDTHPQLLFCYKTQGGECEQLIVRTGGMGEMLGPTVLCSPAAVARGAFDKAIKEIEKEFWPGVVPSLANGGKPADRPGRQRPASEQST